jgi:hypothetical protein
MHTRLIIGNRNSPNVARELVHRRPQQSRKIRINNTSRQ